MGAQLAHRYFDTLPANIAQTVGSDLTELLAAVRFLLTALDAQG